MARDTASNGNLDKLYLKFFKYVVVGLMTLALLAIVVLIPMAALQYLQTPTPATPAKAPPARAVDLEDFKKFLIEEERRRLEQEKSGGASATTKQAVSGPLVSSLYAEQSIQLQRCSEDFRQLAQQETDTASEKELSDRRETQRASIERLASEQFRGPDWPAAMDLHLPRRHWQPVHDPVRCCQCGLHAWAYSCHQSVTRFGKTTG